MMLYFYAFIFVKKMCTGERQDNGLKNLFSCLIYSRSWQFPYGRLDREFYIWFSYEAEQIFIFFGRDEKMQYSDLAS